VMLTHANLIRNCEMVTVLFDETNNTIGVSWLPMYHDMGLVGGVLSPVSMGLSMVLMSPMSFMQRPVRWLKTISKYQATTSGGPNFAYQLCVDKVTEEEMHGLNLSSWALAFNGAEPVRASTLEQFSRKFERIGFSNTSHFPCYGMAETTLIVTGGPRQTPPVVKHFDGRRLDARMVTQVSEDARDARSLVACGHATKNESILIVDTETLKPLPEHAIGEIWIQSPSVGVGYWEKEEVTQDIFQARTADNDGPYLRTGDLGFWSEGQIYVAGRVKDLIIVRGVNRYPQDIEQTVEECHESISSSAAAAFADDSGPRERLIITVEVQRSLEDDWNPVVHAIRRSVTQGHELPPDAVVLVRHGSLPRTSSGKIQRHACLRDFREGNLRVIHQWLSWEDGLPEQAPMIAASTVDHGRPAYVDILNTCVVVRAFGNSRLEWIKVDHQEIDRLDIVCLHRDCVFRIVTDSKQSAMDGRVQRLDATIHHFGKSREFGHVTHLQARIRKGLGGAAGGDEFYAVLCQRAGEINEAGLVGNRDEGASNRAVIGHEIGADCVAV